MILRRLLRGLLPIAVALSACELLLPLPSGQPGPTVTCVDVEPTYCDQIADDVLTSYPSGHGEPATVVIRCVVDAPCAIDRLDSEGIADVTMEDGFEWDRGFGPQVGT